MIDILPVISDDAISSQFMVVIPAFPGTIDLVNTNLRVTTIHIPDSVMGEYFVDYQSRKYPKPNGKIETENNTTFTFRIDKFYNVYRGFMTWRKLIGDDVTGIINPDYLNGTAANRINFQVVPINVAGVVLSKGWTFLGAYPKSVSGFDFDVTGADPLTCTVTMNFNSMDYA
jgi:hypothetical protein